MKHIRHKTRKQNHLKEAVELREDQLDKCRYGTITVFVIPVINGKYRPNKAYYEELNGLQIKNRFYLVGGGYKLINSRKVKKQIFYKDEPEWATQELKEMKIKFEATL